MSGPEAAHLYWVGEVLRRYRLYNDPSGRNGNVVPGKGFTADEIGQITEAFDYVKELADSHLFYQMAPRNEVEKAHRFFRNGGWRK